MPDLWMDVDAALSEVPVNLLPLLDDTDFKTRETAVAFNAAGMDLVWNFVTPAGAFTQTAVTPTSAGVYDWTNQGDGMYTIEIPASGGASINNDTEGYGWFTGFATGVLPWRGPVIGFRAAGLNDLLVESAFSATRGLAGTALPNAAAEASGGLPTLSAAQASNGTIQANVHRWLTGTPNALSSGRVDSSVGAMAANVITAAAIAANAIADTKIAAGAFTAAKFAAGAFDAVWSVATRLLTAGTNIVLAKGTGVTGFNDLDAAGVRGAVGLASANLDTQIGTLATSSALATVDTVVDSIKVTTDKLDDTLEDQGGGVFGFTAAALQEAPTGGSAPTVAEIADAVWEEPLADHSGTVGSTAAALAAASSAGDPWTTALPGAYGVGSAGNIVGNNLNATVSSRASQTSVDDVKAKTDQMTFTTANQVDARTRAIDTDAVSAAAVASDAVTEIAAGVRTNLATELGRIDVAVSTRATQTSVDTVDTVVDAINARLPSDPADESLIIDATTAIFNRLGAPAGASVSADIADVEGKVDDLESRLTAQRAANLDNLDAAVSTRATPAQVNTEADAALADVGLTTTVTGRIDVAVSSRLATAGYTTPPSATAVATQVRTELTPELGRMDVSVSSRATPAQVNQEVLDVLTVDTFAEPTAVPAATATILDRLRWLFVVGRNKITQTSTTQAVRNDLDSAAIGQATVSDDGSTFTRGNYS